MSTMRKLAILGASGAIGRALTSRAVEDGWEVAALDLAATLTTYPPPNGVTAQEVDLRVPQTLIDAMEVIGAVDGFVNLAGFMSPVRPIADTPLDDFDEVMEGNLRGAFIASKAALPHLVKRGGAMVNVASGLAAYTRPGFGPYAAAKAGMLSLTRTLALEAAPDVRVNAVGPSAIDTDFLKGGAGRKEREKAPISLQAIADATPLKRIATPEDVVAPVLFLLSDASSYMTGQTLWINGGTYMP
ncbi:MAG: SDR family oxidoreductase [Pseudomonadota bacterium]